jgi:hypothetical protein
MSRPRPPVTPGGPEDRAFHLKRVTDGFPRKISVESARRLARLFDTDTRT